MTRVRGAWIGGLLVGAVAMMLAQGLAAAQQSAPPAAPSSQTERRYINVSVQPPSVVSSAGRRLLRQG